MGFHTDLEFGQQGEEFVISNFAKHGWLPLCQDGFKRYDFTMEHATTKARHWVEVKRDRRAEETGNLFVEFEHKGKPSCLEATEADIWVFIVGDELLSVYTFELRKLCEGCRVVKGGDGWQARGYLVKVDAVRGCTTARDNIRAGK